MPPQRNCGWLSVYKFLKSLIQISQTSREFTLQTYLKLTGKKLGLLMNFNSALMKDGIARCVNGLDEEVRLPNFAS